MKWAGMKSLDGSYMPKKKYVLESLSNKNDDGRSFKQIANIIDKVWDRL